MMLQAGQRIRLLGAGEEVWRVVHVNDSRAHIASEKKEQVTMGDRSFTATSRRTLDISPHSVVELVDDVEQPATATTLRASTPGRCYVLASPWVTHGKGPTYLRRVQITQAPGYRYDTVTDRNRATEYKTVKGASRSLTEFEAGEKTSFDVQEG